MTQELYKEAFLKSNKSPFLKPISDLGIGFYNMDLNTAILTFQVTESGRPLLISNKNVETFAFCKSSNGSESGVLSAEIKDPLNGIITFTVPNEFLKAATNSRVTCQIYITVNGVDDTVALREITFNVKDALINQISGEIKINHIRMFYELRETIQKQADNLKGRLDEINNDFNEKVNTFNDIYNEKVDGFEQKFTDLKNQLETIYSNTKNILNENGNKVLTEATETIQNINNLYNQIQGLIDTKNEELDSKIQDVLSTIDTSDFVTLDRLQQQLDDVAIYLDWQKYRLTDNDGNAKTLSAEYDIERIKNTPTGFYYAEEVPGITEGEDYGFLTIIANDIDKRIEFRPYNTKSIFILINDAWEPLVTAISDTGWLPINLVNGTVNLSGYPESSYRVIINNEQTFVYFRIAVKNITTATTIATMPEEYVGYPHLLNAVGKVNKKSQKIKISNSGDIIFYKNIDDTIDSEDYAVVEAHWTI